MTTRSTLFATLLALTPALLPAANVYYQRNLVSDQAGVADFLDPNLVNPWGICTSAASPFWISDNKTGLSTLYTSFGTPNATTKPAIPASRTKPTGGDPTGCVANATATAFLVPDATGRNASFLFATESGTLSGWSSNVNAAQAIVMVDKSAAGAVYKGLAIAIPSAAIGPRIYAANFNAGTVEVYDQTWQPVSLPGAFTDPGVPAGFAPFNVQTLAGKIYVAYAKQDGAKKDDVAGIGNGYVSVFDLNGLLLNHLISTGLLNSPWGLAIAPANFGDFAGNLLVGNFGDGLINAYNVNTGALIGTMKDAKGANIRISGLWGLQLGNGGNGGNVNTIYFAAGPAGETHGLFGSLQAAPILPAGAVANAASYIPTIAPGAYAAVIGANLAGTQRLWGAADMVNGRLPTTLDGVSVTVNGKSAYVYYVSPAQIDIIPAADTTQGLAQVVVTNNGLVSGVATVNMATYAPGFFVSRLNYTAAFHADGTIVGPTTLFPNNSTPARSNETIVLYATGLGPVTPAQEGVVVTGAVPTATLPTVTIGGVPAVVTFSGMTFAGLNQINITIPAGTTPGDQAIELTIGGVKAGGSVIAVQ